MQARWKKQLWVVLSVGACAAGCAESEQALFSTTSSTGASGVGVSAGTNGGAGGSGAIVGDAGANAIDPGLDRSVTFHWMTQLPGQGTCTAGKYTGQFACTYQNSPVPTSIKGNINFTLSGSPEQGDLTIGESQVVGYAGGNSSGTGFKLLESNLNGGLECSSSGGSYNATSANEEPIPDGIPKALLLIPGFSFITGFTKFDFVLTGTFDRAALQIVGEIAMTTNLGPCDGTFNASYSP